MVNIENKLDKIHDILTDMKVELTAIRKDLDYHIMRTDLNEERIEKVEDMQERELASLRDKLEPVAFKVNAIFWVSGGVLALAPIVLKILGVY